MARRRRWASTVKPATATRAMSSMPSVMAAIAMVSGLITFGCSRVRLTTFLPSVVGSTPGASNSTITWVGAGDLAGCDEREVVEQVLRVGHDADDVAGLSALVPGVADAQVSLEASPLVTATSPARAGSAR